MLVTRYVGVGCNTAAIAVVVAAVVVVVGIVRVTEVAVIEAAQ